MAGRINLADPDFEPTDEDLRGLSERAFAHVAETVRALNSELETSIAERRSVVRDRVRQLMSHPKSR